MGLPHIATSASQALLQKADAPDFHCGPTLTNSLLSQARQRRERGWERAAPPSGPGAPIGSRAPRLSIVPVSGHFIQKDRLEAVVDVIREVLTAVRTGGLSPPVASRGR